MTISLEECVLGTFVRTFATHKGIHSPSSKNSIEVQWLQTCFKSFFSFLFLFFPIAKQTFLIKDLIGKKFKKIISTNFS